MSQVHAELLGRALRGGIERADRLDQVPVQLQSHRRGAGRREQVHDAAADAPLPHGVDGRHPLVADGGEMVE